MVFAPDEGVPSQNGRVLFMYLSRRPDSGGVGRRVKLVCVAFIDADRVAPA